MLVAAPMAAVAAMGPAAAQEQDGLPFGPWQWQNPLPQGNNLQFAAFNDAGTVIAGGEVGALMRSTDLGQTWTQRPNPVTDADPSENRHDILNDGEFLDADTAVVVGSTGSTATIVRSTDSGDSWSDAETIPASAAGIEGVSFADATTGYAVGSSAVGPGYVMRSIDGGRTWETSFQFPPDTTLWDFLDVSAPTPQIAFATSNDARVVRTTDGGGTWQPIVQLGSGNFFLHAVDFVDADTGVVVGDGGRIFRTADGGDTWQRVPSGVFQHRLMDVTFVTDDIGYVVGELPAGETESGGVVLKTEDRGQSWTPIADTPQWARGVAFADQDTGVVVGTVGMMRRTTDGGQNWTPRWSAATTLNLEGVAFPEPDSGWAVGGRGTQESTLLRSSDGGLTWTPQDSPASVTLFDVDFSDAAHGVAVGGNGTILRTTDGGGSWTEEDSGTSSVLRSVSCPVVNVCTAVGDGGILRSEDGGASWDFQYENFGTLRGVHFRDENLGFAVGMRVVNFEGWPLVLRTTDGGASWHDVSPPLPANGQLFSDVASVDADTWVVVGQPGTGSVQRTTDGGATWSVPAEPDEPFGDFRSVALADDGTGYAGDTTGRIWRTTDDGATWQEEQRRHNNRVLAMALVDPADPGTAVAVGNDGAVLRRSGGGGGGPGVPPSEASQDIVATVPEQPGEGSLIISVDPDDRAVTLPPMQLAGTGDRLATSGELRPVTVTDTRAAANPGWDASAQVSEFNSDTASFGGGFLGWTPEVVSQSEGQAVTAGGTVAPGFPTGEGLSVPQTLATAPAGAGVGVAQLGAGLALEVPVDTPAGTYTAVLTLTAI